MILHKGLQKGAQKSESQKLFLGLMELFGLRLGVVLN
tara:strand:+ start:1024 stop:1134 length:111 start_codon:yes stop_codon:yes gene_type:complete